MSDIESTDIQTAASLAASTLSDDAVQSTQSTTGLNISSSETINSMAELKEKAPEVYQKTLETIFRSISKNINQSHERVMRQIKNQEQ